MLLAEKHHPAGIRAGVIARRAAGPAALLALCSIFFWQLIFTNQYTWMQGSDTAYQVLPWLQYQAGEWHSGRLPLWNPFSWSGQPLTGQGQPGTMNPLNWILFLLPLKNGWLQMRFLHGYFLLLHYLAGLCAYCLCRDLGRTRIASLTGGLVYALGGFFGSNSWPQMLAGGIWAPLVLMYLLRAARGWKPLASGALAGFFWGLCWLSGHHQVPIFVSLALVSGWVLYSFDSRGRVAWPVAKAAGVSALVMFLVSAPQTLPALEYGKLAKRWVGAAEPVTWNQAVPYYVHRDFSETPAGVLGIVLPGFDTPGSAFVGAGAAALAFLGICVYWRRGPLGWLTCLAVAALAYALGHYLNVEGLFYSLVPMVEKARSPHMALVVFTLAVSPLVAYGADALGSLEWDGQLRTAIRGLLAGAAVLGLALLIPSITRSKLADDRHFLTLWILLLVAGLFAGRRSGALSSLQIRMACLLVVTMELGAGSGYHFMGRTDKQTDYLGPMHDHAAIAKFLLSQPSQFRIMRDENEIHYNFGDWYGIEELGGYLASVTTDISEVEPFGDTMRRALGVRYYIGKKPFNTLQQEVYTSPTGLKVFADPEAFPRAFITNEIRQMPSLEETRRAVTNPANNLRATAFVSEPLNVPAACGGNAEAEVRRYLPGRVEITADLPCSRMLVLTDVFYPGWKATVDGSAATIVKVDGALRGVLVAGGHHAITLVYRPGSVLFGLLLGVLGLSLTLYLNFSRRHSDEPAPVNVTSGV